MERTLAIVVMVLFACSSSSQAPAEKADDEVVPEPPPPPPFWGPAPPLAKRLEVFDAIADDLDANYVFDGASLDWKATRPRLRARVEGAETFSELYRVFTDLSRGLRDSHNAFVSTKVCATPLSKRPPLLRGFTGGQGPGPSTSGFCGTALDDDSVLVYRVDEDNPAGLVPGDRIVGFDGKGLRPLLREAIATLPYCGSTAGHSKSDDLLMITSMAYNPHLYQTMDMVRGATGEARSIPTEGLLDVELPALVCNEQIATAIPFPWSTREDARTRSPVSSGVLPGTNIGYIYVYGWIGDVKDAFAAAVTELQGTSALIVDTRMNIGGNLFASYPALRILFNQDITDRLHIATRADSPDGSVRLISDPYNIQVDPATYYDHPIAILTGPLAGSSGDSVTYLLAAHPRARRFGRPTNGSTCNAGRGTTYPLGADMGELVVKRSPCTTVDRAKNPLSVSAVEPDVSVWLTADDVIAGRDTVVEAALAWIAEQNAAAAGN